LYIGIKWLLLSRFWTNAPIGLEVRWVFALQRQLEVAAGVARWIGHPTWGEGHARWDKARACASLKEIENIGVALFVAFAQAQHEGKII
jgi:hypothetical protein